VRVDEVLVLLGLWGLCVNLCENSRDWIDGGMLMYQGLVSWIAIHLTTEN
jgi:hypothetical protein